MKRQHTTSGLTFAQKPYSRPLMVSQNVLGRSSTNSMLTRNLIDLKPYFHGKVARSGAPF